MTDLLVRYLHFLGILIFASSLVAEHLLLKGRLDHQQIRRIAIIDGFYGVGALLVLGAGLSLWFFVGKPADFYTNNWIFHLKVTLFVILGLISIIPTIFLSRRNRAGLDGVDIPRSIVMIIRLELLLLVVIPFLAVLMASGYGLPS